MSITIGINQKTSADPENMIAFMKQVKQAGFESVEITLDSAPFIIGGEVCLPWVETMKDILSHGPGRYSCHSGRDLNCRDLENIELQRKTLFSSIDICCELGLSPLILHYELKSKNSKEEESFKRCHLEAADYAAEKGVLLTLENIEVEPVSSVIEVLEELNHPNLGMNFDTGHAFLSSGYFHNDYLGDFKRALPLIRHMHLSDNTGRFEELRLTDRPKYDSLPMPHRMAFGRGDIHLPPYWGNIPYDDLFRELGDFDGIMVCEYSVQYFLPFLQEIYSKVRRKVDTLTR